MPHENSVFHDILKLVPWRDFDALVERHRSDADARGLTTRRHLIAMLYGQLSGATSLRDLVGGMQSQAAGLYHLGSTPVKRSTLGDANAARPSAVFTDLLAVVMAKAQRRLRQDVRECVYLIDSTTVRLSDLSARWARFSASACGAKAHVIYDPAADCPIHAVVTPSRVNDITAAQAMPIAPGATYVYDLGYYDFAWWQRLHEAGCRIVTRFKSNTPLAVTAERPVPACGPILSDRIGRLPERQAGRRRNPFTALVREVRVKADNGTILRILSNDLSASAADIAALYKRRWAIELFFRWVKQTLRIGKFLGTSENAVRIQIAVALIAFLLLRLAQQAGGRATAEIGPLHFARLVRINLMHRRRIDQLHRPARRPPDSAPQLEFAWAA